MWQYTQVIVNGFNAGETDFLLPMSRSQVADQRYLDDLAKRIATASQSASVVVNIFGYSDRQDRPDMTAEQKRQSEDDAADARADSAEAWLTFRLGKHLGGNDPRMWANLCVNTRGTGASHLIVANPGNNENARRMNRRVEFFVAAFDSDQFPDTGNAEHRVFPIL
jgi:hypothetical protein